MVFSVPHPLTVLKLLCPLPIYNMYMSINFTIFASKLEKSSVIIRKIEQRTPSYGPNEKLTPKFENQLILAFCLD